MNGGYMRRGILMLLIAFLVLSFPISGLEVYSVSNQTFDEPQIALTNPDFIKYISNPPTDNYGYIPPPVDLSYLNKITPNNYKAPKSLPPQFDWRDHNGVTSVKDQDGCGTCWTFGTTSVLESKVKINEGTEYDFSEHSVASCVDRSWVYLYDDADDPCNGGGWSWLASEVFIRKGAVLEDYDPYSPVYLQMEVVFVTIILELRE